MKQCEILSLFLGACERLAIERVDVRRRACDEVNNFLTPALSWTTTNFQYFAKFPVLLKWDNCSI